MLLEQMDYSSMGGREGREGGWTREDKGVCVCACVYACEGALRRQWRGIAEQSGTLLVLPDILHRGTFSLRVY